ncbi:MAG: site-specific integrase [Oribacterium sp.]|nr:site-specific integrase [Oribacterium sp.]
MATVSVQPKGKCWYSVISYKDQNGKWRNKMQTTGLTIKGNKKRAEKIAAERLAAFEEPEQLDENDPYLADYLRSWLKFVENRVEISTYNGYASSVECVLVPYFEPKKIKLKNLTLRDAQQFYDELMASDRGRGGKAPQPTTIRRYHAALHAALEHAVKMEMIDYNPTDRVDLPKQKQVMHNTFTEEQLRRLNKLLEDEDIGPLILFDSVYGLRRSEMCGLRWRSIDFEHDVFTVDHTVVMAKGRDGKKQLIKKDRTKNKSSCRTLPLTPEIRSMLFELRKKQTDNRELFGRGYNDADAEYVFVDMLGNLIRPDYLTRKYSRLRDKYGLPHVTLHEIRHTVATLLLKHKVPMKYVHVTLGHSDISTTANTYMHAAADEAGSETTGVMMNILYGENENKKDENEKDESQP